MKYLKSYKIFETKISDLVDILKDISLDLTDDFFSVSVTCLDDLQIHVTIRKGESLMCQEVKDCVHRMVGYMESEGYEYNISVLYYRPDNQEPEKQTLGRFKIPRRESTEVSISEFDKINWDIHYIRIKFDYGWPKIKALHNKSESLAMSDSTLPSMNRTKELSEDEFIEIFNTNCKNFSLKNDQLWRSRSKKFDLELFTPDYRNAKPLAFPKFFNAIESDEDYPVIRKKSLIGGTNKDIIKDLVGSPPYVVIPYDNSEIVFCPIVDLWAMRDREGSGNSEFVDKSPVSKEHFIKISYTKNFKIPKKELSDLAKKYKLRGQVKDLGYEFFTSSPCLLVHESKLKWLGKLRPNVWWK
jgi:hypothetical protein